MELRIVAEGETILQRNLLRLAESVEVPTEALEDVASLLRKGVEDQFATEGRASGGWKKLTEARVRVKARKGLAPEILRATDRMRDSLILRFDPDHIERLSGHALEFGTAVKYTIYHQSSLPRRIIPYRPPIAMTPLARREIVKTVQARLLAAMRASGEKAVWGQ